MMTREELLQTTDLFLLDLDGTVYLDETPIGDVTNTLARLRAYGKRLVYLTNNSSKTPDEYEKKLRRIGLWGEGDSVYTSAMAAIAYLSAHHAGARVHVLATDAVRAQFAAAGVCLDDETPEVCVLAYDVTLDFAKMRRFNAFLAGGASYIATHPDDVCPTADVPMPDVGSFIALFARSSGRISRTWRASSMPEIKGIRISVNSRSGSYCSTIWRASNPLLALPSSLKPYSCQGTMVQTASRSSSSSSATISV